jgi:tRNA pseudouridine55 synthase
VIVLFAKKPGRTSFSSLYTIKKALKTTKVGHTGTLDPFAEGVLPVCIGKSTRLIEYLKDDKAYIGTVQLGTSTTTYDIEGEVVNASEKNVTRKQIEQALDNFRGDIEQFPPIYSAIKVKGKKLYEYARKGEEIKIEPRRVNISELKILNYNEKSRRLELYVACSKGTYIRSIANDVGEKLGTYGHLIKLIRVKAGNFEVNNSVKLEYLETIEQVEKNLIYPLKYLDYPKYELSEKELQKVTHGMPLKTEVPLQDNTILLIKNNHLIAVGEKFGNIINCSKVFI